MQRVTSSEFVRKFSAYCDDALTDPIVLTRNGRDRLLVISVERYKHLLSLAILQADGDTPADVSIAELDDLIKGSAAQK